MTPKLKRDWVGLRVRLLQTIRNKRGDVFLKGSIMRVDGNRSGLQLRRLTPGKNGMWTGRCIWRVSERDVEIVSSPILNARTNE